MMELPKNEDVLVAALQQANGRVGKEAATYVEHLIKKTTAEIGFVEKVFSDEAMARYNRAHALLNGKDVKSYARIYQTKLTPAEREDYDIISEYKAKEIIIHNSIVNIKETLTRLEASMEVSKQIQNAIHLLNSASIAADKE